MRLCQYLHVSDRANEPNHQGNYDELSKIWPVITMTQNSFKEWYKPGKHLAIDEAMIAFKGHVLHPVLTCKTNKAWYKSMDEMWLRICIPSWVWGLPQLAIKLSKWPCIWCCHNAVSKHSWSQPPCILGQLLHSYPTTKAVVANEDLCKWDCKIQ